MPTTLTICRTCRQDRTNPDPNRDGHRFLVAVDDAIKARGLESEIAVRALVCMSGCDHACMAQIAAPGKFTYVLNTLDPVADVDDLVTLAQTHGTAEHGLVLKSARPAAIKDKVTARVPPLDFEGDPVEHNWPALRPEPGDDETVEAAE